MIIHQDKREGKRKQEPLYERDRKQRRIEMEEANAWWSNEYPQEMEVEGSGNWIGGPGNKDEQLRMPFRLINDLMPLHDSRHENFNSPHLVSTHSSLDSLKFVSTLPPHLVITIPGLTLSW